MACPGQSPDVELEDARRRFNGAVDAQLDGFGRRFQRRELEHALAMMAPGAGAFPGGGPRFATCRVNEHCGRDQIVGKVLRMRVEHHLERPCGGGEVGSRDLYGDAVLDALLGRGLLGICRGGSGKGQYGGKKVEYAFLSPFG